MRNSRMGGTELESSDEFGANSELRLIALELMKMAKKSRRSFRSVAGDYIRNVYLLRQMLEGEKDRP